MSEQQEKKTYFPKSSVKRIAFPSGKEILKVSFKAAEAIEFIKAHTNEKGYINLGISERRETSQYGDTHCLWLDTWQPRQQGGGQPQSRPAARPAPQPRPSATAPAPDEDQEVPF